jgi:hypothetical protein
MLERKLPFQIGGACGLRSLGGARSWNRLGEYLPQKEIMYGSALADLGGMLYIFLRK